MGGANSLPGVFRNGKAAWLVFARFLPMYAGLRRVVFVICRSKLYRFCEVRLINLRDDYMEGKSFREGIKGFFDGVFNCLPDLV